MPKQIWKFELQVTDTQSVVMPAGANPLYVADQNGNLCLWAVVNPQKPSESRDVWVVGTGNSMPTEIELYGDYIGTVQQGRFVWHVFIGKR